MIKKLLGSEKQMVKYIFTIQSLIKQTKSENLVFKKERTKYLDILKIRGGKRQRPFCINQCILLCWGNSRSYEVIKTKCDRRRFLMQIKRKC